MILYHFCANRHAQQIMRGGLTMGGVLEPENGIVHDGYIWLTLDKDPAHQGSWATRHIIPYSRTAWRLTVSIPNSVSHRILGRKELAARWPSTEHLFDGFDGSENWRVFHGHIPPAWIIKAEKIEEREATKQ